jgi:alkylation response protein AidB-like acyl-CoA dehydrogenase
MQDGAASLLKSHIAAPSTLDPIKQEVFTKAFESLTSRAENAWTSGQWMTERSGGSDVSGTETIAIYSPEITSANESTQVNGLPLGPWVIDGFKWFSSATDSQMSIALAQTPGGLSTFYIPMNRTTAEGANELNGISISRLKNKLGTKALPTAELELKGARGFLVGEEGNGIREISAVLNITRIHTAATAIGLWGRGLAIGKAFTKVRHLTGKGKPRLLKDVPLHVKTMADVTLSYRANLLFLHFTVYLLGISDQPLGSPTSQQSPASDYLRPKTSEDLRLLLRYVVYHP